MEGGEGIEMDRQSYMSRVRTMYQAEQSVHILLQCYNIIIQPIIAERSEAERGLVIVT